MPSLVETPARPASPTSSRASAIVGVFDSGIGGLSVLRELQKQLPTTTMRYVADGAYAPYGERGDDYVIARSLRIAQHLVAHGAEVMVVACNTATAAAVHSLRAAWPRLVVVGVEPGIKPAVAATRNGRIGVMATPGTLASDKFRRLIQSQSGNATLILQACPGLATLIERGNFESDDIERALAQFCAPLKAAEVDTVVLGCTHYAFVQAAIARTMGPSVRIIDTAEAVARHAATRFTESNIQSQSADDASLRVQTTGDPQSLRSIALAVCGPFTEVHRVQLD